MNQIADSLDTFIASGLLGRIQNAKHAARMYFLKLDGPPGHGPKRLLELASTRLGRQSIIRTLRSEHHPCAAARDLPSAPSLSLP
jgi:hypothetical protein